MVRFPVREDIWQRSRLMLARDGMLVGCSRLTDVSVLMVVLSASVFGSAHVVGIPLSLTPSDGRSVAQAKHIRELKGLLGSVKSLADCKITSEAALLMLYRIVTRTDQISRLYVADRIVQQKANDIHVWAAAVRGALSTSQGAGPPPGSVAGMLYQRGRFADASREFLVLSDRAQDPLTKSKCLLNAALCSINMAEYDRAREMLSYARSDALPALLRGRIEFLLGHVGVCMQQWEMAANHFARALSLELPAAEAHVASRVQNFVRRDVLAAKAESGDTRSREVVPPRRAE